MSDYSIVYYKDIESRKIEWLWYTYIPYGKITLFQNCLLNNHTHFLHSKGKTDGKPLVLFFVAVRTIAFLSQKSRNFSQKRRGTLPMAVDKTEMTCYNSIMS